MQTGTGARSDRMEVNYAGDIVRLHLSGRGIPLLEGAWETSITVDGRTVECSGAWETVCWNADEAADYLELKLELADGLRVERQCLLPRKGRLAFLADCLITPSAAELTYRASWSLAKGLAGESDTATSAIWLRGKSRVARLYPLGLPAERFRHSSGGLTARASRLELTQRQTGKALYAPVVLDWSPARRTATPSWRHLTVSEMRQPVAADIATGMFLKAGEERWLVYHSLQNSGEPRTVLGHHTWHETVIGAFGRNGAVDTYIEIESPE